MSPKSSKRKLPNPQADDDEVCKRVKTDVDTAMVKYKAMKQVLVDAINMDDADRVRYILQHHVKPDLEIIEDAIKGCTLNNTTRHEIIEDLIVAKGSLIDLNLYQVVIKRNLQWSLVEMAMRYGACLDEMAVAIIQRGGFASSLSLLQSIAGPMYFHGYLSIDIMATDILEHCSDDYVSLPSIAMEFLQLILSDSRVNPTIREQLEKRYQELEKQD